METYYYKVGNYTNFIDIKVQKIRLFTLNALYSPRTKHNVLCHQVFNDGAQGWFPILV